MGFLSIICVCDHTVDEHESSGFFKACLIEGCDCGDYEASNEDDIDDEDDDEADDE